MPVNLQRLVDHFTNEEITYQAVSASFLGATQIHAVTVNPWCLNPAGDQWAQDRCALVIWEDSNASGGRVGSGSTYVAQKGSRSADRVENFMRCMWVYGITMKATHHVCR